MSEPRRLTRPEFLAAILRSWPTRIALLASAAIALIYLGISLWEMKGLVAVIAAVVGLSLIGNMAQYLLANQRGRQKLDEDSRHRRSSWWYCYRGLMWSGLGLFVAAIVLYLWIGRDPTANVILGCIFMLAGSIANIAWENK